MFQNYLIKRGREGKKKAHLSLLIEIPGSILDNNVTYFEKGWRIQRRWWEEEKARYTAERSSEKQSINEMKRGETKFPEQEKLNLRDVNSRI